MDVVQGSALTHRVWFANAGQTLVADLSSVYYTLYGFDGTILLNNVAVTTLSGATFADINIASTHHTLVTDQKFGKRTLVVRFQSGGLNYSQTVQYRVVPWLNHVVTIDKVRALLGVNEQELAENDVDILRAYYDAETLLAEAEVVLSTQLVAANMNEFYANDIILCLATLQTLPSLSLRLAQKEDNGTLSFARFTGALKLKELEETLRDRISEAVQILSAGLAVAPVLITFSIRTDPVTGA